MYEIAILILFLSIGLGIVLLSIFYVEPNKYAQIIWSYPLSKPTRPGHILALKGEQGLLARSYSPGYHFFFMVHLFGRISKDNQTVIPAEKRGLVIAKDGEPLPQDKVVSDVVIDCDNFTDGEIFILNGGLRGPQLKLLTSGVYPINKALFDIVMIDLVVISLEEKDKPIRPRSDSTEKIQIKWPQIGIVTTKIGREIPETDKRILARKLAPVNGYKTHNSFQDLEVFIAMGGEIGIQEEIIKPGAYGINTAALDVKIVLASFVPEDMVGVQVSNIGDLPSEDDFIDREEDGEKGKILVLKKEAVEKGLKRGVLPYTLSTGFHYLNPIAIQLLLRDITPIRVRWDHEEDSDFDPIELLTRDPFRPKVEVEVGFRINRDTAPQFVAEIGTEDELITDIIDPQLSDILLNTVSGIGIVDLIEQRERLRKNVQDHLQEIVKSKFAEIIYFRISNIDFKGDPQLVRYVELRTREINALREVSVLKQETSTEKERVAFQKQRALSKNQEILVTAELQKEASQFLKEAIETKGGSLNDLVAKLGNENSIVKVFEILAADPTLLPKIGELFLKMLSRNGQAVSQE